MAKGLITSTNSNLYQVEVEQKNYICKARGKLKKESLLVGDYVEVISVGETEGVIEYSYPRKNEFKRPKMANLTQLIFVVSMKMPKPDLLLLDKQLCFAKLLGIKSVICLNKVDLVEKEEVEKIADIYKNIGYEVIQTNAKANKNIEKLKPFLKNNITAFAGNSGVGKSTLLNNIFEESLTQEGLISCKNKKGKNTTTSVTLYKYDKNSYLADTPGFSTFEITEIPSEELDHYFIEFLPYLEKCEYSGCNHIKEQVCEIKQAVLAEKIAQSRYENYQKIYQESKQKEETRW